IREFFANENSHHIRSSSHASESRLQDRCENSTRMDTLRDSQLHSLDLHRGLRLQWYHSANTEPSADVGTLGNPRLRNLDGSLVPRIQSHQPAEQTRGTRTGNCMGNPERGPVANQTRTDACLINCWHSCHIMAIRYDYRRRSTLQVPFCARTSPVGGLFESRKSHRERGLRMVRSALFGVKRIFFDRIFERSYWTWRRHPTIIVPS